MRVQGIASSFAFAASQSAGRVRYLVQLKEEDVLTRTRHIHARSVGRVHCCPRSPTTRPTLRDVRRTILSFQTKSRVAASASTIRRNRSCHAARFGNPPRQWCDAQRAVARPTHQNTRQRSKKAKRGRLPGLEPGTSRI